MDTAVNMSCKSWWAHAFHNRLIALVLAMVVIVPLVAAPADSHLTGAPALAFEGFAILLLVTLLWGARLDFNRERVMTFLRTGANLPVLLFFALAVLSCAFSPDKAYSIQETLKIGSGVLLYFVVAYQFRRSEHLSMLVDALLFLAIALCFAGMASYQISGTGQTDALFGNRQPLASLLLILLPMVAVIAITEKGTKRQYVAQFATVLTGATLLLTQTRSSWLGVSTGLLVLGLLALLSSLSQRNSRGNLKGTQKGHLAHKLATQKHNLVLPLLLVVASIGFFVLMGKPNSDIVQRAGTLSAFSCASCDASFQTRVENHWGGAVQMIKARPLTGWGVGVFPLYQLPYTQQGTGTFEDGLRVGMAEQAHNFYLQTAAELGLPGLLLMLAVLGSFLLAGLNRVDKMDSGIRHSLLMSSMAAVAAFAVDAVGSPSWQYGQVSMFLWLTLGVGVSCIRQRIKVDEDSPVVAVSPRVVRPFSLVTACIAVMALIPTFKLAAATDYQVCEISCENKRKNCKERCDNVFERAETVCARNADKCEKDREAALKACQRIPGKNQRELCEKRAREKFPCDKNKKDCIDKAEEKRKKCKEDCNDQFNQCNKKCDLA